MILISSRENEAVKFAVSLQQTKMRRETGLCLLEGLRLVEEAINAAKTVGDDHLQKITQGQIRPEEFTHGTSAQRAEWFRRGMQYHDFGHGDTFGALGLQI